ncbi:hypothetical protein BDW22DRAFT_1363340, partial [Trametopsis cervina]
MLSTLSWPQSSAEPSATARVAAYLDQPVQKQLAVAVKSVVLPAALAVSLTVITLVTCYRVRRMLRPAIGQAIRLATTRDVEAVRPRLWEVEIGEIKHSSTWKELHPLSIEFGPDSSAFSSVLPSTALHTKNMSHPYMRFGHASLHSESGKVLVAVMLAMPRSPAHHRNPTLEIGIASVELVGATKDSNSH